MKRAAVLVSVLLGACASSAAPAVTRTPQLELGTGTWQFEPVTDGETLPLTHGAQGGWHFWVAVRLTGVDVDTASLSVETQPADESTPATTETIGVHLDPRDAEGGRSYLGWRDIMRDPACSVGTTFRVRATLMLANGMRASDERYVVAGPGDYPPPPCVP